MRTDGLPEISKTRANVTISKSIPRNLCNVRIPRVGSICIKNMQSGTNLPVAETRSTQPSNRCIPTELQTSGATVCFSSFSVIGKVLLKVKTEEVDIILMTPSWSAQHCYSQVLELLLTEPLLLPQLCNNFVNPQRRVHTLVVNQTLRLVVWKVSRRARPRKEFQQRWHSLSQVPEDLTRHVLTNWPGLNGLSGGVNGKLIHTHAIYNLY